MQKTHPIKKYRFRKRLRTLFLVVVAVFVLLNLGILLSGHTYLYRGIENTYLKGTTGPTIYDSIVFPYRIAQHAAQPTKWKERQPLIPLTEEEIKTLTATATTSFLIAKEDTIITETYFGKHQRNTKSNSFSAAKSVVGLLIGIAIDEGKIKSFDAPITDYLPFSMQGDSNVTIREVMAMSSGLKWSESGSNPFSDNAEAYYTKHLLEMMKQQKFIHPPGKKFVYKSGNTEILGIILKNATGMSPTAYLEEKIWSKIGTSHDVYWSLDRKDGLEKTFCCLYATTRDYAKLGQLILNKGKWEGKTIIDSTILNILLQPYNPQYPFYGLQFWIYNHPVHPAVYMRGILGQYIIVIPSLKIVMVRTGKERKETYYLPEEKQDNAAFVAKNKYKVHHPKDLFDYFSILDHVLKHGQEKGKKE